MLAVFGAINHLPKRTNAQKKKSPTRTFSGLKTLNPSLFNAPRRPRTRTGLEKTIKTIGAIEKAVVIVALATQDFQTPPHSLESTRPIFSLEMTETTTSHQSRKTKTWLKLSVTIVIRKSILLTSALSLTSQKTSIGLGNLYVSDCC